MPLLRLTQSTGTEKQYRVELALEGDGVARQTATAEFDFTLTPQDEKDLRWYLEDFLQFPADPAPTIAKRVEGRLADLGTKLFRAVLQADDDTRDLWATLRTQLNETRVEVAANVEAASVLPWELLRDPRTDAVLALRAQAFVRSHPQPTQRPYVPSRESGPVRILLVICRPGGRDDVPFRSVATHLFKGLSEAAQEHVHLEVLRPPTFEQLAGVLRYAKAQNKPYHVVHFDGHGTYADINNESELAALQEELSTVTFDAPRTGKHGYVLFEQPELETNRRLVDGPTLGKLLVETLAPVLVLNACRSAHAEAPAEPDQTTVTGDMHSQVRAFGSLAQEVMDAGVAGVVAMRYNVYVATAAQFVGELYAALSQGQSLGEAVSSGRKHLYAKPLRTIAYDPLPLQDWSVPVVYEGARIQLFSAPKTDRELHTTLDEKTGLAGQFTARGLPAPPDAGFFGRDETLLALDRMFDTQSIILLHAFSGDGKTATAAEFARWYFNTGGLKDGRVLFTSFQYHRPLARVLDDFGDVFGDVLNRAGTQWLKLEDKQRPSKALQVLAQVPVLWIWDNVEPVTGFPKGTPSDWSEAEQRELVDFLRATRNTRAKFLLTSRRDERAWLDDLPARIEMPPMYMQERTQLTRAIAEKHGRRFTDLADWRPLLRFSQGNPLTVTVVVGQALRDRLQSYVQIEAFVEELRAGEAVFEDEAAEGRDKSLGASLSYGFEHAFTESERDQLALLYIFQGFVNVYVLTLMGKPDGDWYLPAVRGLTREQGIALLDRAAEIGLLTAYGGGYYRIHPALPWYFRRLFEEAYGAEAEAPRRAFVEAMGSLGAHYQFQYQEGRGQVIDTLAAEEGNLRQAWHLARTYGWWDRVISAMQGLRTLYDHTGRRAAWAQLVEAVVPALIDPETDGPLPGHEAQWSVVTEYRGRLAMAAHDFPEAERLQRIGVDWHRQDAAPLLALSPDTLKHVQLNRLRTLAVSVEMLGDIQREHSDSHCVATYEEALDMFERIDARTGAVNIMCKLGAAHVDIPALRDLDQAEHWFQRGLDLRAEGDRLGRARSLRCMGLVAHERFMDARDAKHPEEEQLRHRDDAVKRYHQTLDLLPGNAAVDLHEIHNALGSIYGEVGDIVKARHHYQLGIRMCEDIRNTFCAGLTRMNLALVLANASIFKDALDYAHAALRNFETSGERAAENIKKTQKLIAKIEQTLSS